MSIVQTTEYRKLESIKVELESYWYLPVVRHFSWIISRTQYLMLEKERLELQESELEDRIYCAKEYLKVLEEVQKAELEVKIHRAEKHLRVLKELEREGYEIS